MDSDRDDGEHEAWTNTQRFGVFVIVIALVVTAAWVVSEERSEWSKDLREIGIEYPSISPTLVGWSAAPLRYEWEVTHSDGHRKGPWSTDVAIIKNESQEHTISCYFTWLLEPNDGPISDDVPVSKMMISINKKDGRTFDIAAEYPKAEDSGLAFWAYRFNDPEMVDWLTSFEIVRSAEIRWYGSSLKLSGKHAIAVAETLQEASWAYLKMMDREERLRESFEERGLDYDAYKKSPPKSGPMQRYVDSFK